MYVRLKGEKSFLGSSGILYQEKQFRVDLYIIAQKYEFSTTKIASPKYLSYIFYSIESEISLLMILRRSIILYIKTNKISFRVSRN